MEQHSMRQVTETRLKCANCQITIHWIPALVKGQPYCCPGCADGGPCTCDYSRLARTGESYAIELYHSRITAFVDLLVVQK